MASNQWVWTQHIQTKFLISINLFFPNSNSNFSKFRLCSSADFKKKFQHFFSKLTLIFFSDTRNSTLLFFLLSPHTAKKKKFSHTLSFQHLHFFRHWDLSFFSLGHLEFFFSFWKIFTITYLILDIFSLSLQNFNFKKNFVNVNPRTLKKFMSLEIVIKTFSHYEKLNTRNYSKQYNWIHCYKTHIHTHTFWSKEILSCGLWIKKSEQGILSLAHW